MAIKVQTRAEALRSIAIARAEAEATERAYRAVIDDPSTSLSARVAALQGAADAAIRLDELERRAERLLGASQHDREGHD